jgi:GTP cyclohydrolase I
MSTEVRVPGVPPASDRSPVERAAAELIQALGLDPAREPELARTPERIAEFYAEAFAGAFAPEPEIATFPAPESPDGIVALRGLEFHSMCVHHFAPFFGRCDIAYQPAGTIVGISGPARLLDHHARRPQLQERLTAEIAAALERLVSPRGVAVRIVARHLCMEMRGTRRRARIETRIARGTLAAFSWGGPRER